MLKIYLANLGKYNEGELVGGWLTLPASEETIYNFLEDVVLIGTHDEFGCEYEEYAIHDFEAPFKIGEYESLERLNDFAERLNDLSADDLGIFGALVLHFEDVELALDAVEAGDVTVFEDCRDMEEVAMYLVEEHGIMGEIPDHLLTYIDYEKLGRDLEIEGTYLETASGFMIEYHG
jgi:antirestriction protein